MSTKKLIIPLTLCLIVISTNLEAVTRGEALHGILTALELPQWSGKSFSDVPPDHPYGRSIESAFAMGILFPTDHFYPDIPASRAEALAFAFMAMGWTQPSRIISLYSDIPKDIPPYLAPYLSLGETVTPQAPQETFTDPAGVFTEEDATKLSLWLKKALHSGIKWRYQVEKSGITLVVQREGVGRPPQGWLILMEDDIDGRKGELLIKNLALMGVSAKYTDIDGEKKIIAGPYGNYFQAWLISQALPSPYRGAPLIPQGGERRSLFWAAVKAPAERSHIVTAPSVGARSLPLSQIASNAGAVGAVNGGFFGSNRPIGTLIIDGIPVSPSYSNRSAIGWDETGEVSFGNGNFRLYVKTENNQSIPVNKINQPAGEGTISLYSPHFGQFATQIKGSGIELLIKDGKIISSREAQGSNHFMGEDKFILLAKTPGLGPLGETSRITFDLRWSDKGMEKASQAIQAGPMLLGPTSTLNEGFSATIIDKRHPRTIAGWDGESVWWIVVDGRDSWHSDGLTMREASSFARGIGMIQAVNMDGGGSSQIWWDGNVVNKPSDGRERPIPYGVIFR